MRVEKDYEELFKLFDKYRVRYCIIGSFAVAFYAKPRYTKDIDVLIEPSRENGQKIIRALEDFGFGAVQLPATDFRSKNRIIQLGYEPVRIDLITSVKGCTFKQAWKNKTPGIYGSERVYFIGLGDLIRLKRKSNRYQDKMDLDLLLEAQKARQKK
jgi:hypothetical protein